MKLQGTTPEVNEGKVSFIPGYFSIRTEILKLCWKSQLLSDCIFSSSRQSKNKWSQRKEGSLYHLLNTDVKFLWLHVSDKSLITNHTINSWTLKNAVVSFELYKFFHLLKVLQACPGLSTWRRREAYWALRDKQLTRDDPNRENISFIKNILKFKNSKSNMTNKGIKE